MYLYLPAVVVIQENSTGRSLCQCGAVAGAGAGDVPRAAGIDRRARPVAAMDDRDPLATPQLLAANRRLLALRAAQRAGRPETPSAPLGAQGPLPAATTAVAVGRLPAHLGWASAPASRALRPALASCTGDRQVAP